MSLVRALWIDSDDHLINQLSDSLRDELQVRHSPHFQNLPWNEILWHEIDVVLMELKLGDQPTLEFVSKMRKKKANLPVLVVTAHACKENCIEAINAGISGLAEKPIHADSLRALIKKHCSSRFELIMSSERKAVFSQEQWVDLTSTEFKILETLKNSGKRLTRLELQTSVWPGASVSENNLDTHLTNLKKKIPELNQRLNVKRGLGYYLNLQ